MFAELTDADYAALLALARRHAARGDEAEDLLHDALIAAARSGEALPGARRAWFAGVLRNLSRMRLRTNIRRRRREDAYHGEPTCRQMDAQPAMPALGRLSPALRVVALLVLSGHTRPEIRHLLRLPDPVLRRRIADIRKHLDTDREALREFPALSQTLSYGAIRQGLLPIVRRSDAFLASHDPDGHPIAIAIFAPAGSRIGG